MPDSGAPLLTGVERAADAPHPGIGHNQPPEEIERVEQPAEPVTVNPLLDPEAVTTRLNVEYAPMMRRFVELEQGAARVPKELATEEEAQRVLSFVAEQCGKAKDDARKAHTKEKKAYLECGKAVDKFFLRRIEAFSVALAGVTDRAEKFLAKKREEQRRQEEEQRRRAEAERRRQEAEAARLRAEAEQTANRAKAAELGRRAEEATDRAEAAQAIVEAPPAPVRLHGEYGATAFFTEQYDYEIVDFTKMSLGLMMPNDEAIRAQIKKGARGDDLPGIRIYPVDKFHMRRC